MIEIFGMANYPTCDVVYWEACQGNLPKGVPV